MLTRFSAVLAVGLFTARPAAHAQASDTSRLADTSRKTAHAPGEVLTPEGRLVKGYFPGSVNGFEKTISFYLTHPEVRPFPKPKYISVDKIRSMTVHGFYFETLQQKGKSLHVLACRLVDGPVQLFNYAEEKGIPVPLPIIGFGLIPLASIPYTKNHWYLKRNDELTVIDRSRFVFEVSTYFADYPALAQKIKQKGKDYQYQDMVRIVTEYNRRPAAAGSK
ncbi:hypothetical protein [Hymenobacter algoricola]|uniref:Uncharacterized protein n=1 Tax=Hymenobacter algoricola TaxID=486267 RepID=A0ABP7NEN5_9BACT